MFNIEHPCKSPKVLLIMVIMIKVITWKRTMPNLYYNMVSMARLVEETYSLRLGSRRRDFRVDKKETAGRMSFVMWPGVTNEDDIVAATY